MFAPPQFMNTLCTTLLAGTLLTACASQPATLPNPQADAPPNTQALPVDRVVDFERDLHFVGQDGSDVVVHVGIYDVDAAEGGFRLTPADTDGDPINIPATPLTHEQDLQETEAAVVTDEDGEQALVLWLPAGTGLQAEGSTSGLRSRGYSGSNACDCTTTLLHPARQGARVVRPLRFATHASECHGGHREQRGMSRRGSVGKFGAG